MSYVVKEELLQIKDYDNVDRTSLRLNSREMDNDYNINSAAEFNSKHEPVKLLK